MKGRENTMGLFTKEQIKEFINENNFKTAGDIQSALKEIFAETMQGIIEAELDTHLGYAKHDTKNKRTTNSRNGKMPPKTVKTVVFNFMYLGIEMVSMNHRS
jgi:transposase-like protein